MDEKTVNPSGPKPKRSLYKIGHRRRPPVVRTGWDKVLHTFYNRETNEILGRTPFRWAQIFGYLTLFYAFVMGFWFSLYFIYKQTISYERPTYTLDKSLIGHYSGLSSLPPHAFGLKNNAYIFREGYNGQGIGDSDLMKTTTAGYLARYAQFLNRTKSMDQQNGTKLCTEAELNQPRINLNESCRFDVGALGDCAIFPFGYGYSEEKGASDFQPCILIKLNRVFDFTPVPFKDRDLRSMPKGFPKKLEKYVAENKELVYVDCQPGNDLAREQLDENSFQYFPENQGIPLGYFPYKDVNVRVSPLVAIKLTRFPTGLMLPIKCRAWHKNMEPENSEADQTLTIYVLVDRRAS